ncbi:MAG: M23 family metallopeptidase [Limisphaerales bacterium]
MKSIQSVFALAFLAVGMVSVSAASVDEALPDPPTRLQDVPHIAQFRTNRSDRFLVDLQYVSAGHPFKGRRAVQPHQGAHIHWDNSTNAWPKGGVGVSDYPAIYAVADGYVDRIDYSFKVGTNDRYGVSVAFAKDEATVYSFCAGIEPMIPEPAPGFYRRYILVSEGQRVKKGDIVAYMYLPPGAGGGSHIHFHIQAHNGGAFLAPAIFSGEIVEGFHAHWNGFARDGATLMPVCMGYLLEADENPFGNGAVDVLK